MICGRFVVIIVLGCFTGTISVAMAQHGGKAEPLRIEFKRGTTRTAITESVSGSEEAEYVLAARKGQKLVIKLASSPARSAVFKLVGPDDDTLGLEHDGNYGYSGTLPKTGDYFITVSRPTTAKGRSRYTLSVSVK